MNDLEFYAYALGYYHARAHGCIDDPHEDPRLRYLYRQGYDSGITDYCREIDTEEK